MLQNKAPLTAPTELDYSGTLRESPAPPHPSLPKDGSYLVALLKEVVANLGKYQGRGAITDDTPEVHGLCFTLEKILVHELKTGTSSPASNIPSLCSLSSPDLFLGGSSS